MDGAFFANVQKIVFFVQAKNNQHHQPTILYQLSYLKLSPHMVHAQQIPINIVTNISYLPIFSMVNKTTPKK